MRVLRAFARRRAVAQIVRREVIDLVRLVEQVIARVDARVKMRVDKSRRDEAALGVYGFIDALFIIFADERDAVVLVYDDAVLDDFVLPAVEADDVPALNQGFHGTSFLRSKPCANRSARRQYTRALSRASSCWIFLMPGSSQAKRHARASRRSDLLSARARRDSRFSFRQAGYS